MSTPTDEQLDALFYHYRWFVQESAPAADLNTLRERQRAAWDAVFGKDRSAAPVETWGPDDKNGGGGTE